MAPTQTRRRQTKPQAARTPPKAPAPDVTFISTYMRHHVIVEAAEDWYTAQGSRQTGSKGKMLVFNNFRCSVPAEYVDLVKALPEFTGVGGEKVLWIEGEWDAPVRDADLQVVSGPILAGPKGMPVALPHPQWDTMTPEGIETALATGVVDLERALQYERSNKNRGIVRRLIAQAIVAATDDLEPGVEVEAVDEVQDTFGLTTQPGGVV